MAEMMNDTNGRNDGGVPIHLYFRNGRDFTLHGKCSFHGLVLLENEHSVGLQTMVHW